MHGKNEKKTEHFVYFFKDKWPLNSKINSAVAIHFVVICHNNVKDDTLNQEGVGNFKKDGSILDI